MNCQSGHLRLMESVRKGSHQAFRQLFDAFYPRLLSYARRFVGDSGEAQDVVQGVFVRLWEGRSGLAAVSLQSLLFTMTRNACLNALKRQVARGRFEAAFLREQADAERLYNFDFYNDANHSLLYDELRRRIDGVIASLPERTQEVFLLSRRECLKNREIAERLGISVKVVERHVSRALSAFRKAFGAAAPMVVALFVC